jgi:hypothetical protein
MPDRAGPRFPKGWSVFGRRCACWPAAGLAKQMLADGERMETQRAPDGAPPSIRGSPCQKGSGGGARRRWLRQTRLPAELQSFRRSGTSKAERRLAVLESKLAGEQQLYAGMQRAVLALAQPLPASTLRPPRSLKPRACSERQQWRGRHVQVRGRAGRAAHSAAGGQGRTGSAGEAGGGGAHEGRTRECCILWSSHAWLAM